MNRQVMIYIAIAVGVLLILSVMRSQSSNAAPVVSLPSAGTKKDAAYYAGQISRIDWASIANAVNTIWGGKTTDPKTP